MEPKSAVEAALFTATNPLKISEIAERTGLEPDEIKKALKSLHKDYESRKTVIRISKIGNEYVMRLKDEYLSYSEKFTEGELSPGQMQTLATIAYNQPVLRSNVKKELGDKVYEHVPILIEKGFINAKPVGHTAELTTTKKFIEYFGVEGKSIQDIRKWIENLETLKAKRE